ncbi:MAG TPA: hypothetical protein VKY90_21525 [Candidatus Dormibacteraeota bacterium]|nr:hypothetical protein [Candidatus Dormibacteraeota bacterium]
MRATHRVALELEVDEAPGQIEPADWDLQDLTVALCLGLARPLRMIRGLVLDIDRDQLSATLQAVAEELEQMVQLYWLATARPWPAMAQVVRRPRPSLDLLVELDQLAAMTRRVSERLGSQGL